MSRLFRYLVGIPFAFAVVFSIGCRRKYAFERVPLIRGQIEAVRIGETNDLSIERIRFWSDELNEPRYFLALIPKSTPHPEEVFILNHGWFDRPEYLLKYLKVDQVYGEMLARAELRPGIVIIPDVRFRNFYRVNSRYAPHPAYLTFVPEEVAGIVSARYGIPLERNKWGIGGFSFGGYLSMDVGRHFPGRFGRVSIISGLVDAKWSFWPVNVPDPGKVDSLGRGKHTVFVPGPVPQLFLACGTDDWRQWGDMQQLHRTLLSRGISHEWSTGPGGHTWEYWSSVLPQMLRFHLGRE